MPKYRMIHIDHYICRPISPFDDLRSDLSDNLINRVPIIRIFGADVDGRKICIHVHGFYPYIAIQNFDPNDKDLAKRVVSDINREFGSLFDKNRREQREPKTGEQRQRLAGPSNVLEHDADHKLGRSHKEKVTMAFPNSDQESPVHRIESIKSYNYYGYHSKLEDFFQVYLYDPKMIKQLARMFEDCKILGRFIPVFWAHLPYILLFFIDNNLRGMQFIEVDHLYWRKTKAPRASTSTFSPSGLSDERDGILNFTTDIDPISSCELEADIRFEWILNRQRFGSKGNNDALKELWLDDQQPSQATSIVNPKLPLYNVERNYIEQLCDCYGVDYQRLCLKPVGRSQAASQSAQIDSEPCISAKIRTEALESNLINDRQCLEQDQPKCELVEKNPRTTSPTAQDSDEFSDDDKFLMEAVIMAETKDPTLKYQGSKQTNTRRRFSDNSMIDGKSVCSPANQTKTGSQHSTSSSRETVSHEYQFLCLMSMELHISTRGKLHPDPAYDPIESLFYCIRNDAPQQSSKPSQIIGLIITDPFKNSEDNVATNSNPARSPSSRSNMSFVQKVRSLLNRTGFSMRDIESLIVDTELELIINLIEVVRSYDPDVLIGYEMEQLSWGYLLERASILNIKVGPALSRISDSSLGNNSKIVESNFVQPIKLTGRMVFSTWRIIKHEVNLSTCSYERIHHHALRERIPCFSFETLTKWFNQNRNRWRVVDYYLVRVIGQMRILDRFDLMAKVSELARVYGTQFIDVITRGSQIGIESMMLRLAKLQNLTPLSPTVMQRNKMKAPEAFPLVLEPETNIYYDPVAVLDFQSLYPSVVIAYNYCYSTCLGRVMDLESKQRHNFGCSQLYVDEHEVKRLLEADSIHVSPCGVAFVKKNIRDGVLPKMLSELIKTRAMVKDQMKKNMESDQPSKRLQRILEHRQHGLKLMANTTYGYTSASYTGRMPCIEIADSIVSKGRETLENAIELVESRVEWHAKVIYGDTDSIFIQFQNCDKDTAFKRAFEMVDAITAANPHPIKMKFEKIYQPCVLQTKKRYCGFKYESLDQIRPEFEAKGIETVRRDCCPAAARMLEMSLRIQFTTKDVNEVKRYVQHQFVKIMSGKLSNIQDFIFARQYKPRGMDKAESVFVPAWQITKRLMATDPRAEPRLNERVPFVIIYGEPRTPLVNLTKTPIEVLENLSYRINADYYIQRIICPTLNRVFCTLGVDTLLWYKSMPHQNIIHRSHYLIAQKDQHFDDDGGLRNKRQTMSQYFSPSHCPVCAKSIATTEDVCARCRNDLQSSVIRITEEISKNQRKFFIHHQICRACSSLERSGSDEIQGEYSNPCISYDCQNLFRYHQAKLDSLNSNFLSQVLKSLN